MHNGSLKIYALSVCFATLLCGAIATGFFLFNLIKIVAPEATIDPSTLSIYSTNEAFRNSPFNPANGRPAAFAIAPSGAMMNQLPPAFAPADDQALGEEDIEKLRLSRLNSIISNHQFRARQSLILQSIIMLICAALYLSHWKLAKKFSA